jgi:hypothetical protein
MAGSERLYTLVTKSDEDVNIIIRLLLTVLVVFLLQYMIYGIYCMLSGDWFWSLAQEDLSDYDYEPTDTFGDGDACCICREVFSHSPDASTESCIPILLKPCAHVVGDKCFLRWITSFDDTRFSGGMLCPYCAQPLARKSQPLYRKIARAITRSIATIKLSDLYNHVQNTPPMEPAEAVRHLRILATQILGVAYRLCFAWIALCMLAYVVFEFCEMSHLSNELLHTAGVRYTNWVYGSLDAVKCDADGCRFVPWRRDAVALESEFVRLPDLERTEARRVLTRIISEVL